LPNQDEEYKNLTKEEFVQKKKAENVGTIIRGLKWLFGWLPDGRTQKIEQLNEIFGVRQHRKKGQVGFEDESDEDESIEMTKVQSKKGKKK